MADRPIIFSAPMVRALMAGRKTQTRRILKPQPAPHVQVYRVGADWDWRDGTRGGALRVPYAPGDRLWAREAHAFVPASAYRNSLFVEQRADPADPDRAAIFREGFDRSTGGIRWRPSIHMPRWASRLTLLVSDVRVQRLQDITEADAYSEGAARWGADGPAGSVHYTACEDFARIWTRLHGPDAWGANPWVAALSFTVHRQNIDQMVTP